MCMDICRDVTVITHPLIDAKSAVNSDTWRNAGILNHTGDPSPFDRCSASRQERSRRDAQNGLAMRHTTGILPRTTFNPAAARYWRNLLISWQKHIPVRGWVITFYPSLGENLKPLGDAFINLVRIL